MLVPLLDVDQAFAEVDALRRRMDGLLQRRGSHRRTTGSSPWGALGHWTEGDDAYELTLDVPGATHDDVEVSTEHNQLTVSVRRTAEPPEGTTARHRERRSFEWTRTVTLPDTVDADKITARLADGVLMVTLPRAAASAPRTITVES